MQIQIQRRKQVNTTYKIQADSIVLVRTVLLTSRLQFIDTKRERHNSYFANPTYNVRHISWCLRSQFISAGRGPKNLTTSSTVENTSMAETQLLCLHGSMSTPNWLFFKILKFSGPSLLGMTSSTLQPHFLSGGLLWQWWLSYPLRTSVKLYPMTVHLNSRDSNSSKLNQTEW